MAERTIQRNSQGNLGFPILNYKKSNTDWSNTDWCKTFKCKRCMNIDHDSDHILVRAKIRKRIIIKDTKLGGAGKAYNIEGLTEPKTQEEYRNKIRGCTAQVQQRNA